MSPSSGIFFHSGEPHLAVLDILDVEFCTGNRYKILPEIIVTAYQDFTVTIYHFGLDQQAKSRRKTRRTLGAAPAIYHGVHLALFDYDDIRPGNRSAYIVPVIVLLPVIARQVILPIALYFRARQGYIRSGDDQIGK